MEITHLLIPGVNDDPKVTCALADFMATHLGSDTPLHISRYFPRYRMDHAPTPGLLLERAWEIARKRLDYVYVGNIIVGNKENTYCPGCGELLISRSGYSVNITKSLIRTPDKSPKCANCNKLIPVML